MCSSEKLVGRGRLELRRLKKAKEGLKSEETGDKEVFLFFSYVGKEFFLNGVEAYTSLTCRKRAGTLVWEVTSHMFAVLIVPEEALR